MKHVIIIFFLANWTIAFAQSFQFIENGSGAPAQPVYTRLAADTIGDEFTLHCINNSSVSKSVKVRMTILSTPAGCSNDVFFCDPIACYPPNVFESVIAFSIPGSDTTFGALIPRIAPGNCCGDYQVNYCLYDVNNESDSVNLKVNYTIAGNHCTNGIAGLPIQTILCTAYPNPVSNRFVFSYRLSGFFHSSQIVIYDASGKLFKVIELDSSAGEIGFSAKSFSPGIYYYGLLNSETGTSFKKLIILN